MSILKQKIYDKVYGTTTNFHFSGFYQQLFKWALPFWWFLYE